MLLRVDNIFFEYPGGPEVLNGASFSADKGEVVAIIGPNGSGKTTLLMIAAGLLEPGKGTVFIDEEMLGKQLPEVRRRIGIVFQEPDDQLFNPTVHEEIAFALRQLLTSTYMIEEKIREITKKFEIDTFLEKPPYKLSIGEKRIVTLASVLAYDPDILLLDEPTANLSSEPIGKIEQVVADAKHSGKVVVVASHDVEFVATVSDRVYIINNGSMSGGTDAKSILSDEQLLTLADMKPPLVLQTLRALGIEMNGNPLTVKDVVNYKRNH